MDNVHDVANIAESAIEQLPDVGFKMKSNYLMGVAKVTDLLLMSLNIDRILSSVEFLDISTIESQFKV